MGKKQNYGEAVMAIKIAILQSQCDAARTVFKAILLKEKGKPVTGHELTALFSQLANETQNALEAEFNKGKYLRDLSETLKNCNNIFVDFRYLHEDGKKKEMHTTDLGNLARALRTICKNDFGFDIFP